MRYTIFLFVFAGFLWFFSVNSGSDVKAESYAAAASGDSPVVLELFTSQSCSSCPPADRLLRELAQKVPNILALSCHVTYWNHLSWKDTLSHKFCTDRQRSYAAGTGTGRVYTPALWVNGVENVVGSRRAEVVQAVKRNKNKLRRITVERLEDGGIRVKLPGIETAGAIVSVLTYGEAHTQSIKSGENRGLTVSYTNPVNGIRTLIPQWGGRAQAMRVDMSSIPPGSTGLVILAQEKHNGHVGEILAAGQYTLP